MECLQNDIMNLQKEKKRYYYYDNGYFYLEYHNNKWYLYNYDKCNYTILNNIDEFINKNKTVLNKSKINQDKVEIFVDDLIKLIGNFTFCTTYICGWNICNSKIRLKIIIYKFKSIDNKTIKIQYTINDNVVDNNISVKQLLKFVTSNIDMILYKDLNEQTLNKQELNELKLNQLNLHENELNIKPKLTVDEIKKKIFIKLSKAKKIYYQSCLPYDDNKNKLEKIYGMKLDL